MGDIFSPARKPVSIFPALYSSLSRDCQRMLATLTVWRHWCLRELPKHSWEVASRDKLHNLLCLKLIMETSSKSLPRPPQKATWHKLCCSYYCLVPASWKPIHRESLFLNLSTRKPNIPATLCSCFKRPVSTLALCLWLPVRPREIWSWIESCEKSPPPCHESPQTEVDRECYPLKSQWSLCSSALNSDLNHMAPSLRDNEKEMFAV